MKKHHCAEMGYDPSDPVVDESAFEPSDFGHLQGKEELPPNMPKPCRQGFVIDAKDNADHHAADTGTRRSGAGFFVHLNCAPICCLSKKQTSYKSSSFGSEFVAMKQCCKHLQEDFDTSSK
jgi:hypothetical protein